MTLTAFVLTALNFPFALVSLHQPQRCQLWPASPFQAISSIVGAVNWVLLRPRAYWRCSEDSVHLSHIITSLGEGKKKKKKERKYLGFLASLAFLLEVCTNSSLPSLHSKNILYGASLVVQWLRLCAPKAGGLGLILHQRTRSHVP